MNVQYLIAIKRQVQTEQATVIIIISHYVRSKSQQGRRSYQCLVCLLFLIELMTF